MATKEAFENEDFDPWEALESAIDKRRFLLNRVFANKRVAETMEDSNQPF